MSQQLERAAKVTGGAIKNRFEILAQAESYPDRAMRPGSVVSDTVTQLMLAKWDSPELPNSSQTFPLSVFFLCLKFCKDLGISHSEHCE